LDVLRPFRRSSDDSDDLLPLARQYPELLAVDRFLRIPRRRTVLTLVPKHGVGAEIGVFTA
jgi:hypothetical protein